MKNVIFKFSLKTFLGDQLLVDDSDSLITHSLEASHSSGDLIMKEFDSIFTKHVSKFAHRPISVSFGGRRLTNTCVFFLDFTNDFFRFR